MARSLCVLLAALFLVSQAAEALITTTYPGPVVTTRTVSANAPCYIVREVNLPVTVTTSCGTVTAYLLDHADHCEQLATSYMSNTLTAQCYNVHYPWSSSFRIRVCTPTFTTQTQTINVNGCTANVDYTYVSNCVCNFPPQLNLGLTSDANVYRTG
eukprot:Em0007g618a